MWHFCDRSTVKGLIQKFIPDQKPINLQKEMMDSASTCIVNGPVGTILSLNTDCFLKIFYDNFSGCNDYFFLLHTVYLLPFLYKCLPWHSPFGITLLSAVRSFRLSCGNSAVRSLHIYSCPNPPPRPTPGSVASWLLCCDIWDREGWPLSLKTPPMSRHRHTYDGSKVPSSQ